MPSNETPRPWEGDWTSAPKGCSPTAIAWLLISGHPAPDNAPADAVSAARSLIEAARTLGQEAPLPPPRKPPLWETWDDDIEDGKGKISAAHLRLGMHFAFHPDPDVQKERFYASRGMSVKMVKRFAREIVESVPRGYDPREHPWFPAPELIQGIGGCPLCHEEGSRIEQQPVWKYTVCPCKRTRQERMVARAGLSLPTPSAVPAPAAPRAPVPGKKSSILGQQFIVRGNDPFEPKSK